MGFIWIHEIELLFPFVFISFEEFRDIYQCIHDIHTFIVFLSVDGCVEIGGIHYILGHRGHIILFCCIPTGHIEIII